MPHFGSIQPIHDVPNVFVTDRGGNANVNFEIPHPFPDPAAADGANRLNNISLVYHSDEQNWGACAELLGPGVEVHGQMRTPNFPTAIQDLVTESP